MNPGSDILSSLLTILIPGSLGEKYYGLGIGLDNFVCVWVSETVGMGIVLNGNIYLGKNGFVGEIGHTKAVDGGPLCVCGNSGCLETVINEGYILNQCRLGLQSGVNSLATNFCGGQFEKLSMPLMIKASNQGDRFCRNIFEETAEYLGNKLTDVANLLNPELITLRGSVFQENNFLLENVRRIVKNKALTPICDEIRIESASFKGDIRLSGISSYILTKYFRRN